MSVMRTTLYVALYQSRQFPQDDQKFHWLLVPFRADQGDTFQKRVQVYQVIAGNADTQTNWKSVHHKVDIMGGERLFYGCVQVGTVALNLKQIDEKLRNSSCERDDTPLLPTIASQGREWSCAQWILRILKSWSDEGLMNLQPVDIDSLYNRICCLGRALRCMEEDSEGEIQVDVDGYIQEAVSVNGVQTLTSNF